VRTADAEYALRRCRRKQESDEGSGDEHDPEDVQCAPDAVDDDALPGDVRHVDGALGGQGAGVAGRNVARRRQHRVRGVPPRGAGNRLDEDQASDQRQVVPIGQEHGNRLVGGGHVGGQQRSGGDALEQVERGDEHRHAALRDDAEQGSRQGPVATPDAEPRDEVPPSVVREVLERHVNGQQDRNDGEGVDQALPEDHPRSG
jgi:hypothetical protein